ncbi:hypothetical protein [Cerasicoccus frondis]|uniref:hypothetical protein n=1 Tax=Cerasicoccus frondis TaxID=490090 RepID=UPI002852D2B0|nr:hypothetical protein [Cerasicoccus frondis]
MSLQIDNSDNDASVTGAELIPVSDSGSPKHVTITQVRNFTIDEIEAITAALAVSGADSVFIMQGGSLKPVDIDLVAQHAIDTVWGKTAETDPDSADVIPLKDGGTTEKTITLAYLATYVKGAIEAAILDISDLDAVASLNDTDELLVTQGTTAKKVDFSEIISSIYESLATHVTGKDAVTTPTDSDVFYVIQGGAAKKITLEQIADHIEGGIGGTGTADALAQWVDEDTLKAGPAIAESFDAGSNSAIPTTKAVRDEMDVLIDDSTDIGAALDDADELLVYDNSADSQRKSALTRVWTYITTKLAAVTDISTYGWFVDEDDMSSDDATKAPSQQSVKAYVDANSGWDGDASDIDLDGATDIGAALADADLILVDDGASGTNRKSALSRVWTYVLGKISSNGLDATVVDLDGATDIGADLEDSDLILVDDGAGGTNRKSALSRIWTYILAKITAVTDVSGYSFVLDEDTLSSDDATKVPTQQSVKAYVDAVAGVLNNFTATSDPTAGDDSGDGYSVGSLWVNTTSDTGFVCLDNSASAAIWQSITESAAGWDGDITDTDIAGGTDIGADLEDGDLIVVDDGAGGTIRKSAMSRVKTYSNKLNTASYSANQTLTVAECNGYVIYVTAACTITLPAIASGMSVTVITIGDVEVSIDPNASDLIMLDGTALDDGDKITNGSASGDIAVLTYYTGDGWHAATNGWTDGGA